jgi:hypothetical protein
MKKIITCTSLFLALAIFKPAAAQFQPTNNTGDQPKWGLPGHDFVEYYYLPDIDTYYYVPGKQFIYQSGGYWTFSSSLPAAKRKYDLRSANKVVINEPGAYRFNAQHKSKYATAASGASIQKVEENSDKQMKNSEKTSG